MTTQMVGDISLHEYILRRDGMCVAAKLDPVGHPECMTRFGRKHRPDDLKLLTMAHVKEAAATGVRAPSDRYHLIAECGWANNEGWSSANRDLERDYLAEKEPR